MPSGISLSQIINTVWLSLCETPGIIKFRDSRQPGGYRGLGEGEGEFLLFGGHGGSDL